MPHQLIPRLIPQNDLDRDGDWWVSTGDDPYFLLDLGPQGLPSGWSRIRLDVDTEGQPVTPTLYLDEGTGFSQKATRHIATSKGCPEGALIKLPRGLRALRFDPLSGQGRFRINALVLEPVSTFQVVYRRAKPMLSQLRRDPSFARRYAREALRVFRQSGVRGLLRHALRERSPGNAAASYADWVARHDTLTKADLGAIEKHAKSFTLRPLISVLVPLYNTPEPLLRKCIDSVMGQIYSNWELCLVDDGSSSRHVAGICERYAQTDQRIKFLRRPQSGHIAAATNSALGMATGEFVALLDHDDQLAVHALYMVAAELNADPGLDLLFSDEDKIDEHGVRFDPWFKSDWNYDLMLSQNAVVHLAVYRRSILDSIGGFRSGFDGSQDYDVTLRFSEQTTPARICHIPHILYHWRAIAGSVALAATEKAYPYEAAAKAIQEHLDRTGAQGRVSMEPHLGYYRVRWALPTERPQVALIIPTKDKIELLRVAVESILEKTTYENFEILVVNNRSEQAESLAYFESISRIPRIRVLSYDHPYSFAALNNWAASQTDAPLLGFVNNDIEVIEPEWLTEMVSHALRAEVGAVGAKLFYPNETIQHAGVVVGIGGLAGHPHVGLARGALGYFGRAACTQQFSAVTAACMVMRRSAFQEVGGFDAKHFAVAFNDVESDCDCGGLDTPSSGLRMPSSITTNRRAWGFQPAMHAASSSLRSAPTSSESGPT